MFAFAVLFFLGNHLLESSALPLEMVFDHRNYLAGLGPLMYLAYLVVVRAEQLRFQRPALVLGALLLTAYTAVAYIRVDHWSSYQTFTLNAAENHPGSPRSNFMAGQFLISALDKSGADAPVLADAAQRFLEAGLRADERCINCLFGLLVLDLHRDRRPSRALLERLQQTLRSGYVGPTKVSVNQFSFLVQWQRAGNSALANADLEAIFEAALANPDWPHTGLAGIQAAYRKYFEFVDQDLEAALRHARAAIDAWPIQWSYHMQLVQVLEKLGRHDQALLALGQANSVATNAKQQRQTADKRIELARHLSD